MYNAGHDKLIESAAVISRVMGDPPDDPVAIVDAIARIDRGDAAWDYVSFASKLVHLFVAP